MLYSVFVLYTFNYDVLSEITISECLKNILIYFGMINVAVVQPPPNTHMLMQLGLAVIKDNISEVKNVELQINEFIDTSYRYIFCREEGVNFKHKFENAWNVFITNIPNFMEGVGMSRNQANKVSEAVRWIMNSVDGGRSTYNYACTTIALISTVSIPVSHKDVVVPDDSGHFVAGDALFSAVMLVDGANPAYPTINYGMYNRRIIDELTCELSSSVAILTDYINFKNQTKSISMDKQMILNQIISSNWEGKGGEYTKKILDTLNETYSGPVVNDILIKLMDEYNKVRDAQFQEREQSRQR